jgi:hypothetical protein
MAFVEPADASDITLSPLMLVLLLLIGLVLGVSVGVMVAGNRRRGEREGPPPQAPAA